MLHTIRRFIQSESSVGVLLGALLGVLAAGRAADALTPQPART